MTDDVTAQRLSSLETQVRELHRELEQQGTAVNGRVDSLHVAFLEFRGEVAQQFREVELRVTTEVREVAGLVRDVKSYLIDRDDTRSRLAALEKEFAALRALVGGGRS